MSENFGLAFAGTFDGSMYGTSPVVFSVWFYVIANGFGGEIDLHPKKLADTLGTTTADVEAAIRLHCAPDPTSRSQVHEGRRLLHLGGVRYAIVNHELYKNARALEEKRASDRLRKRASRERQRDTTSVPIFDLSQKSVTECDSLLSLSSDLISSDPEGVPGDHAPPPEAQPSRTAPADFAPTEAQRARCSELGHDPDKLAHAFKRHRFKRGYSDWGRRFDQWIEDEVVPGARASSPPAAVTKGPRWVDATHSAICREQGWELATMARVFYETHHVRPDCLKVGDARTEFRKFLLERARSPAAA